MSSTFVLGHDGWVWKIKICKFIIDFHGMHYLFVRRSNKQKMRSGIISDFTKGIIIIIFFIFYNNQVILRVISQCIPPSCIPSLKKDLPLSFSLVKRKIYLEIHMKEEFASVFTSVFSQAEQKEDDEHFYNG